MLLKWMHVFELQLPMGLCRFSLEGVFSMQAVLFHLLCCSEVTVSLLDHAAGNLELSPELSASQNQGISFKRSKCTWRVSAWKHFGALSAYMGLMRNEFILPLVSCSFLRFSVLPSVEFQQVGQMIDRQLGAGCRKTKCGSRNFLLLRRMG